LSTVVRFYFGRPHPQRKKTIKSKKNSVFLGVFWRGRKKGEREGRREGREGGRGGGREGEVRKGRLHVIYE